MVLAVHFRLLAKAATDRGYVRQNVDGFRETSWIHSCQMPERCGILRPCPPKYTRRTTTFRD